MSESVYLTPRQKEILTLVTHGNCDRQIAERLGIKLSAVTTHVSQIYPKIGARSRVQAALWALRNGLVNLDEVQL